jgi:hypothetical protein
LTESVILRERLALPMEMRAAIDLAVLFSGGQDGMIRGRAIGQLQLVTELGRYAPLVDVASTQLLALGVAPEDLREEIVRSAPEEVVTIVLGPLAGLVTPLRTDREGTSRALTSDLPRSEWRSLGYQLRDTSGVQGVGSLFWIGGERLCRRAGRPDLADRCRIAMLRTLLTVRPLSLSTIRLRRYRRVSP